MTRKIRRPDTNEGDGPRAAVRKKYFRQGAEGVERASTPEAYEIEIALDEIEPRIWRRLVVPASLTLSRLHRVIQTAFGWTNSHLHQFVVEERDVSTRRESKVSVADLVKSGVQKFIYEYDFGDDWIHHVRILKGAAGVPAVRCIAGARAGPPEDSGGPFGYENLLVAWADRRSPDHRRAMEWLPPVFKPEQFDPVETTRALAKLKVS